MLVEMSYKQLPILRIDESSQQDQMKFEYGDLVMGTHDMIVSMLNDYSQKCNPINQ